MRGTELLLLYCSDFSTGGNSIQTSVIFFAELIEVMIH